jgi:hypothetical protein
MVGGERTTCASTASSLNMRGKPRVPACLHSWCVDRGEPRFVGMGVMQKSGKQSGRVVSRHRANPSRVGVRSGAE